MTWCTRHTSLLHTAEPRPAEVPCTVLPRPVDGQLLAHILIKRGLQTCITVFLSCVDNGVWECHATRWHDCCAPGSCGAPHHGPAPKHQSIMNEPLRGRQQAPACTLGLATLGISMHMVYSAARAAKLCGVGVCGCVVAAGLCMCLTLDACCPHGPGDCVTCTGRSTRAHQLKQPSLYDTLCSLHGQPLASADVQSFAACSPLARCHSPNPLNYTNSPRCAALVHECSRSRPRLAAPAAVKLPEPSRHQPRWTGPGWWPVSSAAAVRQARCAAPLGGPPSWGTGWPLSSQSRRPGGTGRSRLPAGATTAAPPPQGPAQDSKKQTAWRNEARVGPWNCGEHHNTLSVAERRLQRWRCTGPPGGMTSGVQILDPPPASYLLAVPHPRRLKSPTICAPSTGPHMHTPGQRTSRCWGCVMECRGTQRPH